MSNDSSKNEPLSVRTPWGSLAKSEGIQANIDSLKDEIATLNRRLRDLEKSSSSQANQPNDSILKTVSDFDMRIKQMENRISDLDIKFEKFSAKTLQILEQLRKGTF